MNMPVKVDIMTSDGVSSHIYDTMSEALLQTNTVVVKLLKKFNVDSFSVSYSHYEKSDFLNFVSVEKLTEDLPF